jgi:hypothetical protein
MIARPKIEQIFAPYKMFTDIWHLTPENGLVHYQPKGEIDLETALITCEWHSEKNWMVALPCYSAARPYQGDELRTAVHGCMQMFRRMMPIEAELLIVPRLFLRSKALSGFEGIHPAIRLDETNMQSAGGVYCGRGTKLSLKEKRPMIIVNYEEQAPKILAHEIGHWAFENLKPDESEVVRAAYGNRRDLTYFGIAGVRDVDEYTKYFDTSRNEWFAETFATWHYARGMGAPMGENALTAVFNELASGRMAIRANKAAEDRRKREEEHAKLAEEARKREEELLRQNPRSRYLNPPLQTRRGIGRGEAVSGFPPVPGFPPYTPPSRPDLGRGEENASAVMPPMPWEVGFPERQGDLAEAVSGSDVIDFLAESFFKEISSEEHDLSSGSEGQQVEHDKAARVEGE